jgi:hypothetical protein
MIAGKLVWLKLRNALDEMAFRVMYAELRDAAFAASLNAEYYYSPKARIAPSLRGYTVSFCI